MLNPFRYFNSSAEIIRLTVMMYIRELWPKVGDGAIRRRV
jgi:predicted anti-sigma-YlaC factor YlaD